ncbi:TMEM175 family protein [Streptomyces sp. NBC_01198]|uniref:TMEM175 family protein n=1 Tax=Streptomyces sp. NBC_01198 TaxID=2903769 RepID=UPI002E11EFB8|nr:TMEM175 family protein [Streptomyces sp. NBC_01198]
MSTEPPQSPDPGAPDLSAAPGTFQATDTNRVEAFSDGVFAVAITILALEMHTPPHRSGDLLSALPHQWPVYLGYFTSFAYIGVIWLNHHQAFTRIRVMDRELHVANLALLFTTASLPFPTGVPADALQEKFDGSDVRTAVVLYALVAAAMCGSWAWIYFHLARGRGLLDASVNPGFVPHGLARSAVGIVVYLLGGGLGWALNPGVALAAFVLLPLFYFTSTGGIFHWRRRTPSP